MSRPGTRAANRLSRSVQSSPLVFRMHRSAFSAAIVARPSGWLTRTFRMAICRDTHNSTPQLETALNLVLPGWGCLQTAIGRWGRRPGMVRAATVSWDRGRRTSTTLNVWCSWECPKAASLTVAKGLNLEPLAVTYLQRGNLSEDVMTHWHDTMVDRPETDGAIYVTGWTISGLAVLVAVVAVWAFGI